MRIRQIEMLPVRNSLRALPGTAQFFARSPEPATSPALLIRAITKTVLSPRLEFRVYAAPRSNRLKAELQARRFLKVFSKLHPQISGEGCETNHDWTRMDTKFFVRSPRSAPDPQFAPSVVPLQRHVKKTRLRGSPQRPFTQLHAKAEATNFPLPFPPKHFPGRPLLRPLEPTNTHVMDGHGNWSAPDNNQTQKN